MGITGASSGSTDFLIYAEKPVWECQTAATCECRSLQIGGEITRYLDVWAIGDLKKTIQPKHNSNSIETGINWLRIISVYSQLKLTKASDCLLRCQDWRLISLSSCMAKFFIGYGLKASHYPCSGFAKNTRSRYMGTSIISPSSALHELPSYGAATCPCERMFDNTRRT